MVREWEVGRGTHGYYTPGKGIDAETGEDADPAVSSIWWRRCWWFCRGDDSIKWLPCIIVLLLGVIGDIGVSAISHLVPVQFSSVLRTRTENEERPFAPSSTIEPLLSSYVMSAQQRLTSASEEISRILELKMPEE